MANEFIRTYGTELTLEANGQSTSNGNYVQANDNNLQLSNDAGFPYLLFKGSYTFSIAPDANSTIKVYARNLDIISSNDGPIPSANYQHQFLCHLTVTNVTSTQYLTTPQIIVERPHFNASIYIKNEAGQSLSSGWTLYCTPWTYEPKT